METAAKRGDSDLLRRFLELTDWKVEITPAHPGFSGLAVRWGANGPERLTAYARSASAVTLLLFEQACARAPSKDLLVG